MRAVCSGTRGGGCCGGSDMAKPPEITAPTPLSTFRPTHSPTVSARLRDLSDRLAIKIARLNDQNDLLASEVARLRVLSTPDPAYAETEREIEALKSAMFSLLDRSTGSNLH